MKQEDFIGFFQHFVQEQEKLLIVKGGEYAGSNDRLANFKRGSSLAGVPPLTCAFIYSSKHYDSIATFVRDSMESASRPRSEPIRGRLLDLANYCILMAALIEEEEAAKRLVPTPNSVLR